MKKWNRLLVVVMAVAVLAVLAGCAGQETPYEKNDAMDYTVSVKYDANGGVFTTNTTVIVDSYNLQQLPKSADGKAQIALITPDHTDRGNNAFTATRTGYFLAGYTEGMPIPEVLRMSAKASSIAVSRAGAVPSIPWRKEVLAAE